MSSIEYIQSSCSKLTSDAQLPGMTCIAELMLRRDPVGDQQAEKPKVQRLGKNTSSASAHNPTTWNVLAGLLCTEFLMCFGLHCYFYVFKDFMDAPSPMALDFWHMKYPPKNVVWWSKGPTMQTPMLRVVHWLEPYAGISSCLEGRVHAFFVSRHVPERKAGP